MLHTIALMFGEFFGKYYDLKIKLLALGSETLTLMRRNQLKTIIYPNAQIADLYGSAEISQYILYPCSKIIAEEKVGFTFFSRR